MWGQQLYAVLLPLQVLTFLYFPSRAALMMLAFAGCLADWTPYVSNSAMAAIALLSYWRNHDRRALGIAIAIIVGCLLAGLTMIVWFSEVMSLQDYFADLARRSADRATGPYGLDRLAPRYVESFGLFVLVLVFAIVLGRRKAVLSLQRSDAARIVLPSLHPLILAIGIFGISMLENLLMKDHAVQYSYDRLKGVQLLALLVAYFASFRAREAKWVFSSTVLAGVASLAIFRISYDTPAGWHFIAHSPGERLGAIIASTAAPDAPAFLNGEVRGAEVYYAGRNIFEDVDNAAQARGTDPVTFVRDWCKDHGFAIGTLYEVSGRHEFPYYEEKDLPRSVHVQYIFTEGRVVDGGTVQIPELATDYHPFDFAGRLPNLLLWRKSD